MAVFLQRYSAVGWRARVRYTVGRDTENNSARSPRQKCAFPVDAGTLRWILAHEPTDAAERKQWALHRRRKEPGHHVPITRNGQMLSGETVRDDAPNLLGPREIRWSPLTPTKGRVHRLRYRGQSLKNGISWHPVVTSLPPAEKCHRTRIPRHRTSSAVFHSSRAELLAPRRNYDCRQHP